MLAESVTERCLLLVVNAGRRGRQSIVVHVMVCVRLRRRGGGSPGGRDGGRGEIEKEHSEHTKTSILVAGISSESDDLVALYGWQSTLHGCSSRAASSLVASRRIVSSRVIGYRDARLEAS